MPWTRWLTVEHILSLEAWSPRLSCWPIWFLVKALFQSYRWPSFMCSYVRERTLQYPFLEGHSSYQCVSQLMTSSIPNNISKASSPNTITLGLVLQHTNTEVWWGTNVQPTAVFIFDFTVDYVHLISSLFPATLVYCLTFPMWTN